MKLNYEGDITLSSQGYSFSKSESAYEVSDKAGIYLLKTFPKLFKEVIEKKIEKIEEPKEEKKEVVKAKPKAK